jgi:CheY-like chemotaxis protein
LGLATVYGIVRQNEGFVKAYSEPGRGTTIRIYLPRFTGEACDSQQNNPSIQTPPGTETVLVVEDDHSILTITRAILERLGYTPLTADKPQEALRLAREYSGEIHLLITDVVMPEMNGRELAKHLAVLRPAMKCLYMSGYTADVIAHHGVIDEGVSFIQKPFTVHELAGKIREVLGN